MLHLEADVPDFALEGLQGTDFTFICPTEILGFQRRLAEFEAIGASILGVSVDDAASHRDWSEELGGLGFPLLCDPGGDVARRFAS